MRYFFLASLCIIASGLQVQAQGDIINELKTINAKIAAVPCGNGYGNLISYRGLNLFLAGKIGSYLSEGNDLSFYKNNITLNTSEGILTVNHSLFQASGVDEQVRKFMVVGVNANIANGFASAFAGKRYSNDFGFTIRQTWLGNVRTYFEKCSQSKEYGSITTGGQKPAMDALRAVILHTLEIEINKKISDFEHALSAIDSAKEVPGQDMVKVKMLARVNFYTTLKEEYYRKFANIQAQTLLNTNNYNRITTSWTSISGYVPLIAERFTIAKSLSSSFNLKRAYPLSVSVSHTRFWESTKFGRLFLTISGEAFLNNSKQSQALQLVSYDQYRILGGTDTINVAKLNSTDLYLGSYRTFITPLIKGKIVYIPPDWHFGITLIMEKNFGTYQALNGTLGVPIVLIDKHSNPSINFEFQVHYFDISNQVIPDKKIGAKVSVGLTVGIPFSKIIY